MSKKTKVLGLAAIAIIVVFTYAAAETDPIEKCMEILKWGVIHDIYEPSKHDAVITLGLIGDKKVVPLLIKQLEHQRDKHLRCDIAKALGWIGDKRAAPALIEALEKDDYKHYRCIAALVLGDIGDKKTVPALEKALKDDYYYVRSYAAESLKKITGKDYPVEGEEKLTDKLRKPDGHQHREKE